MYVLHCRDMRIAELRFEVSANAVHAGIIFETVTPAETVAFLGQTLACYPKAAPSPMTGAMRSARPPGDCRASPRLLSLDDLTNLISYKAKPLLAGNRQVTKIDAGRLEHHD